MDTSGRLTRHPFVFLLASALRSHLRLRVTQSTNVKRRTDSNTTLFPRGQQLDQELLDQQAAIYRVEGVDEEAAQPQQQKKKRKQDGKTDEVRYTTRQHNGCPCCHSSNTEINLRPAKSPRNNASIPPSTLPPSLSRLPAPRYIPSSLAVVSSPRRLTQATPASRCTKTIKASSKVMHS